MRWLRSSLRLKLFFVTFTLTLLSIVSLTYLHSQVVQSMLESNFRTSSIETSEKIGNEIDALISRWGLAAVFLLQSSYQLPAEDAKQELQRFLDAEKDFVASVIIEEDAGAFKALQSYAKDHKPEWPERNDRILAWLKELRSKDPLKVMHLSSSKLKQCLWLARGLPTNSDGSKMIWVVIEADKNPISTKLRFREGMRATLVGLDSKDLMSGSALSADLVKVFRLKKIDKLLSMDLESGFFGRFLDSKNVAWQGAYYRLPLSELTLVLQQKEEVLFAPLNSQLVQTAKWAALILLVSVLFSFISADALIAKLERVTNATESISQGRFDTRISISGSDEVKTLANSVNTMANRLQNLLTHEKNLVHLEHELNIANEVQASFIPDAFTSNRDFTYSSSYRSASACGGDFWGHYVLAPEVDLVLVGDATGHGIPAALVTAIAYATSHFCSNMPRNQGEYMSPALVLSLLNRALADSLKGSLCMTFFAAILDKRNQRLIYSNAGHPFPILIPKNPKDDRLNLSKPNARPYTFINDITKNGALLGFDAHSLYHNVEIEFRPGDRLVLYTDGIVECYNSKKKQWGMRNFEKAIQRSLRKDVSGFKDEIIKDLEQFRFDTPLADDATLVVVACSEEEAA